MTASFLQRFYEADCFVDLDPCRHPARQLAMDLGPYGITVNALAPGLIHADPEARIAKKYRSLSEEEQRKMTADIPMGRPGTGEEVANAALFFASSGSSYVSGDLMTVTGAL